MTALATMNPTATSFQVPVAQMPPPTIGQELTAQPTEATNTASAVTLPGAMSGRGSGREGTAQKYGARPPSEQAVLRALRWLQSQQQTTGMWGSREYHDAFTGLALLCFLGHGETPLSHEFGGVVTNALNALIAEGNATDSHFSAAKDFNGNPAAYQHGICTYALCEAYTMTKDPRLEPIVRQAVDYIIKGQRPDGGWAYSYDLSPEEAGKQYKSDTSVSGWQIQALKAAHLTGLSGMDQVIPTLNNAMKNLDRVFNPKDGAFGYRVPGDAVGNAHHLTGVGVLAKLFWLGRPDRTVREGLKNIESGELSYQAPECDLYAWYYDTQACFQAQGSAWDWWNSRFQDLLTSQQSADGSWPPTGGNETFHVANSPNGDGPIYRTTLCCLMLEVFYRYLPTSQDDALGSSTLQGL
jgi:hypothetical protein